MENLIPTERVESRIYLIRGQKVMIDRDLAELYGVSTARLNEQVKRNKDRFPPDFMFFLTRQEILSISQFAISSSVKFAKNVNVFTEQGVAMLSGVLRSKRAVQVNVAIMRAFVKLRQILSTHKELAEKLNKLEQRVAKNELEVKAVFDAIRELMRPPDPSEKKIGFLR